MSEHTDAPRQLDFNQFVQPSKANVIVGGQFGSEAKGLVASYIAADIQREYTGPFFATTNAGAQAGHTTILPDGTRFVCYHLPTVGVLLKQAHIHLNAGSIIDIELLAREIAAVSQAVGSTPDAIWSRLSVHPYATVITPEAREIEMNGATAHLGSTQKGVGAALAAKIMRDPKAVMVAQMGPDSIILPSIAVVDLHHRTAMIEIPQGTSLSLNSSGFYPKTTSRECWVGQGLLDAEVHPSDLGTVNMVVRTHPIRVGHIYHGLDLVGHSGPFYDDGEEIDWDALPGVEPERTTVTQRVRRIARWSRKQYRHSLRLNRPDNVFLTFTNYCTNEELNRIVLWMREDEHTLGMRSVHHLFSWGPRSDQVSSIYVECLPHCRRVANEGAQINSQV